MSITAPSFDNAPEWANFVAMDSSGDWYWYEKEPKWLMSSGIWARVDGRGTLVEDPHADVDPSQTLTARPSKESHQ